MRCALLYVRRREPSGKDGAPGEAMRSWRTLSRSGSGDPLHFAPRARSCKRRGADVLKQTEDRFEAWSATANLEHI